MSDNGTAFSSPTVAWDNIGDVAFQRIKQALGPDGTHTGDQAGRLVDGSASAAAAYTENRADVVEFVQAVTVAADAHADGEAIGGLITITNAAKAAGEGCRVESITIIDLDNLTPTFDIVFFRDSITAPVDSTAFDPSDADLAKARGGVEVLASNYSSFTDNGVASLLDVGLIIPDLVATSLYAVLVSRAAITFTTTSAVTVIFGLTRL